MLRPQPELDNGITQSACSDLTSYLRPACVGGAFIEAAPESLFAMRVQPKILRTIQGAHLIAGITAAGIGGGVDAAPAPGATG